MAKKTSLDKARAAYSKNKNTKYTWKDGQRTEKKKKKKKKQEAASHYGQVEKRTRTAGDAGEKNRATSRSQTANAAKSFGTTVKKNFNVNKTTATPKVSTPNQYKGASRTSATVTPVQVRSKGDQRRAANARGGLASTVDTVKTSVNPRTVGGGAFVTDTTKTGSHYGQVSGNTVTAGAAGEENRKNARKKLKDWTRYKYDDQNTENFLGEDALAKGTGVGTAYNRSKTGLKNQYEEGKKTVTVDTKKEKAENAEAIYKESTKSEKNTYNQLYDAYYKRLGGEYDKAVKEYGEEAVRAQFGTKEDYVESALGTRDDFIKDSLDAGKKDRLKEANTQAEKESKYTYSKAPISTNQSLIEQNASLFQNTKVTSKTDKDRYVTDKNGNIKYDITFGEDGKPIIKPKTKKGKEKVETTQGANIIDYYAGGFNEKGELTSQKGSQKVANTRAGWFHDSPFMAGVLQGSGYADLKRGLGQYSRAAAKDVDKTTESGKFLAGYMGGIASQFFTGGYGKMADALVKGVGKNSLARTAKNIGLRKAGASALFEAPVNTLDAVKMSTDANGNFNKDVFKLFMGINTGLSGAMGGLIGGIGAKMTKSQARDYLRLSIKAENVGLTEAEAKRWTEIQRKFAQMRESGNVANADIANKAEYDAIVASKVFDRGGTAEDAYKLIDNTGTNVEKMNMSASIKENADIQFEFLKAERDSILEQMAKASPEERAILGRQASELRTEMNRLGEIANTAESNLAVAKRQNRTSLRDLTSSLENMSKRTGVNYEVVDDVGMHRIVGETMARKADELEASLKSGDVPAEDVAAVEARIKEYREGVSDDVFYKGFYYKDENGETRILINSDSPQAYQTVVGHETGHLIKKANEEEFYALGDQLEKFAREFGDYDAVVEDITRSYPNATATEIREEVICELLGRYVYGANDKVLKQIAGEKPSLLRRIVDYFKELLSKTTDRAAARELTAIIDKIDSLTENVGVKLTKDGKVREGTYSVDENIPAKQLDESGAIVEKNGNPVAQYDKDGSFKASISTYEESGRDELKKYVDNLVKEGEMSEDEAKQLIDEVEDMYKICKKYADSGEYEPFSTWSMAKVVVGEDGKPVFTSVRKNAEYPMNLDFSTICKKRRTLDAVFNELIRRGVMDELDLTALGDMKFMAAANDTIRKYGFEAACEICFVEARRYRQRGTAKQFTEMYNQLVDSLSPDKSKISYFNYGKDSTVSEVTDGIHTLDNSAVDTSYLEKAIEEEKNKAIQSLEKKLKKPSTTKEDAAKYRQSIADIKSGEKEVKTVRADTARFLMENPSQRRRLQIGDLMSSNGFEGMQTQNPELMKLYNRKKGTGGAKATFGDVQYMNEIINSKTFNREAAYAVAGVRAQSFSDYVPRMVFDYIQMVGDLAAKRLPMHVYTKEPLFVKQFGLTGMKINMSLIPDYDPHGIAAGLDADGNYLWNADGTFPYDEAVKLQGADGYRDNVGTIAVGVSNKHIEKMLDDPNIQMVIPYHKSSLNKRIAKMRNVDKFEDYTKVQETKVAYGSTKSVKEDFPFNEELYKLSHGEDGNLLPREEWGDPRELTDRYLAWCEENGYQPKFPQFKDHPNYYKLLEDFGLYDGAGNFKPQHDVQARFPTEDDAFGSMKDLIRSGLEEDAILEGKRKHDVPKITDEIIENAKKNGWLDDDFKASAAGRKAKGADTKASDLALSLKADGLSNDEIKKITGWYIAKDGKPRFEFSDSGFKIKDAVYADYHPEKATTDRVLITASEKRDSAMRDFYTAAQDADPHGQGAFDIMLKGANDGKTIGEVRKELQAAAKDGKIPKETATVDTDLATKYTKYVKSEQGFSKKSRGTVSPTSERLANVIDHDELFKFYPEAKDIKVNFVDRTKDGSSGFFDSRANSITVVRGRSKDDMESTLIHEIQHWIQHKEGHAGGASVAYWNNVMQKIESKLVDIRTDLSADAFIAFRNAKTQKEKLNIIAKDIGRARATQFRALEKMQTKIHSVVEDMDDAAYDAYYSTLGEQEARNASASRRYTEDEIRNSGAPFYAKEDTESIVREDFDNFADFKFSQERVVDSSGKVTRDADKAYMQAVKRGDMETAQKYVDALARERLKGTKVSDPKTGNPREVYHETMSGEFTVFDKARADVTGWDGGGFYFTTKKPSGKNSYGGMNRDNQMRIERRAEDIMRAGEHNGEKVTSLEQAKQLATEELAVGSHEFKTYLDIKRPVIYGKGNPRGETTLTIKGKDITALAKYATEPIEESYRAEAEQIIRKFLRQGQGDGVSYVTYTELKNALDKQGSKFVGKVGSYIPQECSRRIVEKLGYDGIIDYGAAGRWKSFKMAEGEDYHAIAFKPSQIKSTEAVTRTDSGKVIPLSKRFDTEIDDIRFSMESRKSALKRSGGRAKRAEQSLKEQRENAAKVSRLEKERDRLWGTAQTSKDGDEVYKAVTRAEEIDAEIKTLRSPKETVTPKEVVETPKAETPKAPRAEKPVTTPAPKPEVPTSQTKTKASEFRNTAEYKTFTETPSSYASDRFKQMTETAMNYDVDVSSRIAEFNALGKVVRANRAKAKNSKTPSHIQEYERLAEEAEIRQTQIAESIYLDVKDKRLAVNGIDATSLKEISSAVESVGGVKTMAENVKRAMPKNKATKLAEQEVKDFDKCLDNFVKGDPDKGLQNARAGALLDDVAKRLEADPNDTKAVSDLMKVVDALGENSTLPANVRNSAKTLATATPKGRLGVAVNAVETLNKKYTERIEGTLSLTEEEKVKLATTPQGEELDQLYFDITCRLWDQIPASRMEKFNEIRHMFMLANLRTHGRNFFGNITFRGVRRIADDMEIVFQNTIFKRGIEKRGGQVERVRVTGAEISDNDKYLTQEFHDTYDSSGSVSRYMEIDRPDGVPVVKAKALNWLIQKNYRALEKEDMVTFIPAFKKSYVQYVKAKDKAAQEIIAKGGKAERWEIGSLTDAQKKMARERALFDAEYATFRDITAFSSWITGKKHWLAQKEGNTIFGTAMYRLMNAALEGVLPFVKTPVNILRRAVDFSPISLFRGLAELSRTDPDTYMLGIKHLSTGLTGTGIFGLGFLLADLGHVSIDTKLGGHSGSKYYDQDMGYQDYSLVIHVGDYHKSFSLDWVQPMEASLFMGAACKDMVEDFMAEMKDPENNDFSIGTDLISGLFAVTSPMLDASFMSSTKDMIETFERRAGRETAEGEPDMAGALAQMLFADIPKNYVSSIVPQVVSQAANASDKYQRDTRSTMKDPIAAAWDSAGKQLINRIPVLRQYALNPKLDRWGDDKRTGRNVALRIFDSIANPSTVKEINENKYDRELFKIRNDLPKGSKQYKNFFYNFTGNPNYDLDFGKGRMSYNQAYEYGKAVRKEQGKMVRDMIDSETYKDYMNTDMKAQEVDKAYWTAVYKGDQTIGNGYAAKRIIANEDGEDEAWSEYKRMNAGKKGIAKEFVDFYIKKEELYQRAHPTAGNDSYNVKALACYMYNPQMLDAYDVHPDKRENVSKYWKDVLKEAGGNKKAARETAIKETTLFTVGSTYYLKENDAGETKKMQSVALGMMAVDGNKSPERVYRGMGFDWNEAQAGGGLMLHYNKKGKYKGEFTFDKLKEMKYDLKHNFKNEEGKVGKAETENYVNSLGISDPDLLACLFETLCPTNANNPFGTIKDWLEWNTEPDEYGSGGRGGWGRGGGWGHGGGGGGGKTPFTPEVYKASASKDIVKVTNPFSSSTETKPSNLDEAYRKKARKLREASRKVKS